MLVHVRHFLFKDALDVDGRNVELPSDSGGAWIYKSCVSRLAASTTLYQHPPLPPRLSAVMLVRVLSFSVLMLAVTGAMMPLSVDSAAQHALRAGWSWSSCGTEDDILQIHSIEISPSPPVPGKTATLTVVGTVHEDVEVRAGSLRSNS